MAGAAGLCILAFAAAVPWVWLSLACLPLAGWFFDEQRRDYEGAFIEVLDAVASEEGLVKLEPQPSEADPAVPTSTKPYQSRSGI